MSIPIVDSLVKRLKGLSERTKVLLLVSVIIIISVLLTTNLGRSGQDIYRGEVWGDLEIDGEIEQHGTVDQTYMSASTYSARGEHGKMQMTVSNVHSVTIYTLPEQGGTRTYRSYEVKGGSFTVETIGGSIEAVLTNASITYRYTELSGHADSNGIWNDPDYEVVETLAGFKGSADLPPIQEVDISKSWVDLGDERIEVLFGGFSVSGSTKEDVTFEFEGHWSGRFEPRVVTYKTPYSLDGTVSISDFRELDDNGDRGRYHERFQVSGNDIVITTLEYPSTWSHWQDNLEPWTIEITVGDTSSVRSYSPIRATILVLVFLGAVFVIVNLRKSRFPSRPQTAPEGLVGDKTTVFTERTRSYRTPVVIPHENETPQREWMPIVGGAICIARGLLLLIGSRQAFSYYMDTYMILTFIVFPLLSVIGGTFAVMRRGYGLAIMGAIGAILGPGIIVAGPVALPVPWLGLVALILIMLGKKEFQPLSDQGVDVANED